MTPIKLSKVRLDENYQRNTYLIQETLKGHITKLGRYLVRIAKMHANKTLTAKDKELLKNLFKITQELKIIYALTTKNNDSDKSEQVVFLLKLADKIFSNQLSRWKIKSNFKFTNPTEQYVVPDDWNFIYIKLPNRYAVFIKNKSKYYYSTINKFQPPFTFLLLPISEEKFNLAMSKFLSKNS